MSFDFSMDDVVHMSNSLPVDSVNLSYCDTENLAAV